MSDKGFTMQSMPRHGMITAALEAKMTIKEAAEFLGFSCRQALLIKKRVIAERPRSIYPGNKGRKPAHTLSEHACRRVLDLAKDTYRGVQLEPPRGISRRK